MSCDLLLIDGPRLRIRGTEVRLCSDEGRLVMVWSIVYRTVVECAEVYCRRLCRDQMCDVLLVSGSSYLFTPATVWHVRCTSRVLAWLAWGFSRKASLK